MSSVSAIQWTDRTWNPVRGCSVVSPGCVNCYAMKQAHRFSGPGGAYEGLTKLAERSGPQWTGKVAAVEDHLLDPLKWRTPARVFVNSMSDLFHEDVPDEFIDRVFAVMALAPQHTFQILTKRADRMRSYCASDETLGRFIRLIAEMRTLNPHVKITQDCRHKADGLNGFQLENVWLGVSVENQKYADERIPQLLQTPAAVRFVSAEPLLGPVDLTRLWRPEHDVFINAVRGGHSSKPGEYIAAANWPKDINHETHLDWVIVGGESGTAARPFDIAWARSIVKQCSDAGVACFVKQLGAWPFRDWPSEEGLPLTVTTRGSKGRRVKGRPFISFADKKGADMAEWPADLRVRQFPSVPR